MPFPEYKIFKFKMNHKITVIHPSDSSMASANDAASPEFLDSLLDLLGGFETQFHILQYARRFYLFGSNMQEWPVPQPPSHFQSYTHSWDAIQRSSLLNGFPYSPVFNPVNSMIVHRACYGFERSRPRGSGTYFPILNRPPRGYRPSSVKGSIQAPARSFNSNVRTVTFTRFLRSEWWVALVFGWTPVCFLGGLLTVLSRNPMEFLNLFHFYIYNIEHLFKGAAGNQDLLLPSHQVFNPGLRVPGIDSLDR